MKSVRRGRVVASRAGTNPRPAFESLEDRRILAVVNWDGGGDGVSWHDGNNWDTNAVPGIADDAVISIGANPTIQFTATSGSRSVNSLLTDEAITFTGGTLTVVTTADVDATATMNGGTLNGGTWDVTGGAFSFAANSNNRFTQGVTVLGAVNLGASGRLRVENGWTVSGTVTLPTGAQLGFLGNTTLTGADYLLTGGTMGPISAGAGSHTLTIGAGVTVSGRGSLGQFVFVGGGTGHLVNNGIIRADAGAGQTLTLNPATSFTNNNEVSAVGGAILTIFGTNNTTETFTNTGAMTQTSSTLNVGGLWSSTGTLAVTGGTVNLGGTTTTAGLNLAGWTRAGGAVNLVGIVDNTAATLAITAATGQLTLNGGTIRGGTIDQQIAQGMLFAADSNNRFTQGVTVLGAVNLGASGRLRVENGWTVSGTVTLPTGAQLGFLGNTTLTGADYLLTGGTMGPISAGAGSHTLTIGAGVTLSGRGSLGQFLFVGGGTGHLVNNGTIRADAGAGQTLTLNPATSFTNNNEVSAVGGAILTIFGTNNTTETFTNTGALIQTSSTLNVGGLWSSTGALAVNGGTVNLGGTTTTAGLNLAGWTRAGGAVNLVGIVDNTAATLAITAATGQLTLNGGTIRGGTLDQQIAQGMLFAADSSNRFTQGVTVLGAVNLGASGRLRVEGGWTVSGTVAVPTGAQLGFLGNTTLTGADYLLTGGTIGPISAGAGSHTLTIGAGVTVSGRGSLGQFVFVGGGTGHLVNNGIIRADAGAGQTLTLNPQDTLTNNGTLAAAGGGILQVAFLNWLNTGTLDATTGGRLNFTQGLVLGAGGTVQIGFAGATNTQHGRITVTGNATLDGAFAGRYDGGYVPPEGTFHDFMTVSGMGSAILGQFASLTLPTPPSGDKSVFIQETTRLRLLSTDLADFDENGTLDIFDFLMFQNLWDAGDPRADLDTSTGVGVYDIFDFLVFFNLFGDG